MVKEEKAGWRTRTAPDGLGSPVLQEAGVRGTCTSALQSSTGRGGWKVLYGEGSTLALSVPLPLHLSPAIAPELGQLG